MKWIFSIITVFFSFLIFSQGEKKPFVMHKEQVVVHTSLSYKNAPFTISDKFKDFDYLRYKANMNLIHGIGIAYQWFAININYKLPQSLKDQEKFGETKYFDFGLNFSLKKWYFRLNYHYYEGFGIKNAKVISDSIPLSESGYFLNKGLTTNSIGINAFYFFDDELNYKAASGIVGRYTDQAHGFYIRSLVNLFSIYSPKGILPHAYMEDPPSIHRSQKIGAFEVGAIPGYAYLNNINGWQFSAFVGLGGMIQTKYYTYDGNKTRAFLGLAPRIDLMLQGGYNVDNWFLMLTSSFNQNGIRFNSYQYNQFYYNFSITYGYRFNKIQK